MKPLKLYKFLLACAQEYLSGYEFPVWKDGKWKTGAQWKLDHFIKETEN